VADLLLHGADVNAADPEGKTPLIYAAHHSKDGSVLTALLKAGADLETRYETGATALMYAACNNLCEEAVPTLLAAGADVLAVNNLGCTALVYAVQNGLRSGTFTELMRAAMNTRAKGRTSWDAMDEAAAIVSETLSAHLESIGSLPASESDEGESQASEPPQEA
jgi:ankyrin repeat protein